MIAGFALIGFAWIAVFFLTIGLACNAVWRAVMPPPGTPRHAGCGSCGYELTTLDHGRCSECGADLLKAGVATRRNIVRTAGSLPAGIMGWTILSAVTGSIILYAFAIISMLSGAGGLMAAAGGGTGYDSNYSFGSPETYDTDSGEFARDFDFDMTVDIDVIGDWSGPATSGTIAATLESGDQTVEIRFDDASTADWVMVGPAGETIGTGTRFTSTNAKVALDALGLTDDAEPRAPDIASEVETIIDSALNNPFNYEVDLYSINPNNTRLLIETGGSSYNNVGGMRGNPFASNSPADWIVPIVVTGLTLAVWLGGLLWMIRRRSRLIQGPRDAAVQPA